MSYENLMKIRQIWRRAYNLIRNAISEIGIPGKGKRINETFTALAAIGMCSWTFYWFDYSRKEHSAQLSDTFVEIFLKGILK